MKTEKITKEMLDKLYSILEEYKRKLYDYNRLVSEKGYRLKPVHIVVKKTKLGTVKYMYFGRYWYKVVYVGKSGKTSKVKWVYLGKEKPEKELPDPPRHPLEGLVVKIDSTGIYVITS
ncbi:hypothetical protein J4526_00065 [Desulfurococcaceae archaeon MEX13E-LK6-19]|nr:hypothetical protein J4526_00065 [Desulfurococcaceae archaeon MEX13E-LK6-19]